MLKFKNGSFLKSSFFGDLTAKDFTSDGYSYTKETDAELPRLELGPFGVVAVG